MHLKLLTFFAVSSLFLFSCGGGLAAPKTDEDSAIKNDADTIESVCGDEVVTGSEVCDGTLDLCTEIDQKRFKAGKAYCKDDCSGWNTITCEEVPQECGNTTVEGDEVCDGGTMNCRDIDDDRFVGGLALCKDDCSAWNIVTCEEKPDYDPPLDEDVQSDEDIVCVSNCETVGAKRCSLGTQVESCQLFEGGCKMWKPLLDCNDSGRFCHDYLLLGDDSTNNVRNHVLKGNYIHATESMTIRSFDMMLNITTEQRLTWVIYESETIDGTYVLIFQNDVEHSGTGQKFYNSGPLFKNATPFSVETGKYYLFGVAWENDMISYYHDYTYSTQEEETLFGSAEGGTATDNSWPIQETMAGPAGNSLYFMRFDADNTASDICECINDCDTSGEEQCSGDTIQECLADATSGCLSWENQDDCTSHFPAQICSASDGVASCQNNCDTCPSSGDKQCNDFVIQQCNSGSEGCLEWQYNFDCAAANKWCTESGTDAYCVDTPDSQTEYIGHEGTQSTNKITSNLKLNFIHATRDATLTGMQLKLSSPSATVDFRIYESITLGGPYTKIASQTQVITNETADYVGPTNFNVSIANGNYYALGIRIGTEEVSYYFNTRSDGLPAYDTNFSTTEAATDSSADHPESFENLATGQSIYNMKLIYDL